MIDTYRERLRRLLYRYHPAGVLLSDTEVHAAAETLRSSRASAKEMERAHWICDSAMHPVLQQPIPSAFRLSAFAPITTACALGMVSGKSPIGLVFFHCAALPPVPAHPRCSHRPDRRAPLRCTGLYQSHSAATRYCNYADTSRPLDGKRMLEAYAISTAAACSIAVGSLVAVARVPWLRPLGLVVPHAAVCVAGAASTVLNNEADLAEGVQVSDAAGKVRGLSQQAAREGVGRAVLLQSVLVPGCALLAPVLAMRSFVVPRLMYTRPLALWPISAVLVAGGVCVLTPAAAAMMPRRVAVPASRVEPELRQLRDEAGRPVELLYSSRILY